MVRRPMPKKRNRKSLKLFGKSKSDNDRDAAITIPPMSGTEPVCVFLSPGTSTSPIFRANGVK